MAAIPAKNKKDDSKESESKENPLAKAQANVLVISEELPKNTPTVHGVDFNKDRSIDYILNCYKVCGFQATNVGLAVERINEMLDYRLTMEEIKEDLKINGEKSNFAGCSKEELEIKMRDTRCTTFLGLTSNMISSGTREVIRYICEHNMVDCIVTTCGAIEEDVMKLFAPHYMGSFELKGRDLRLKGQNRIGNLIVPNNTYCKFEDWLTPILLTMLDEQKESFKKNPLNPIIWTPSKLIRRLGKEIGKLKNCRESVWYWCYKNNIPVFSPAITDGAVGDVLYFLSYKHEGFILDIARDIRGINDIALSAHKSGMIILGGGLIKHHICNANLMRNGANWSVFVNTGQEFDGSDSGARPDEAVSWGKIRLDCKPVKVYGDATALFPLIAAGTFAHPKHHNFGCKPKRKLAECYDIPQLK